jgi:hypothetical protein
MNDGMPIRTSDQRQPALVVVAVFDSVGVHPRPFVAHSMCAHRRPFACQSSPVLVIFQVNQLIRGCAQT